ncbi:hypothetical protein MKW98_000605 [Papaver atlanticum]|uniref:Uncharacterized protein n=1 Tax=Papaver atlanticum TaxID=357466 RepID=A0AAD4X7Y7_9MAGN|nr:hypothetical protein MKW98_000605 [Papaver atlanticum]
MDFCCGFELFEVLTGFSSREMNKKMVYFHVCKVVRKRTRSREIHIQLQNRRSDTNKGSFLVHSVAHTSISSNSSRDYWQNGL